MVHNLNHVKSSTLTIRTHNGWHCILHELAFYTIETIDYKELVVIYSHNKNHIPWYYRGFFYNEFVTKILWREKKGEGDYEFNMGPVYWHIFPHPVPSISGSLWRKISLKKVEMFLAIGEFNGESNANSSVYVFLSKFN